METITLSCRCGGVRLQVSGSPVAQGARVHSGPRFYFWPLLPT